MKQLVFNENDEKKFDPRDCDINLTFSLAANTEKIIPLDKKPRLIFISSVFNNYAYNWFGNTERCLGEQYAGVTQSVNTVDTWANISSIVQVSNTQITIKHTSSTRKYYVYVWY